MERGIFFVYCLFVLLGFASLLVLEGFAVSKTETNETIVNDNKNKVVYEGKDVAANTFYCIVEYSSQTNKKTGIAVNDSVDEFIDGLCLWYPEYIKAQYRLESGNCKSVLAKDNNNLFGMMVPKRRMTTANKLEKKTGYAKYDNWQLSVLDRILWEIVFFDGKKPSLDDYKKSFSVFAEDEGYLKKLDSIIKTF